MNRIKEHKKATEKWSSDWSPRSMEMLQDNKEAAFGCKVIFNGADGYEIGEGNDKHTVHLEKHLCTCRAWDITGIPCAHALCALHHAKIDPMTKMSKWYHKTTYMDSYHHPIQPVPGKKFMKINEYKPIEPPPLTKLAGRPRKKRIRASTEPNNNDGTRLSRRGQIQTCRICYQSGHNRTTCPNRGNQVILSTLLTLY